MKRTAKSMWQGNLKQGKGALSTESGVLMRAPYSFAKRFENEPGTNPEELIGAAHSGCFAMALAGELEKKNLKAESINVEAEVTLNKGSSDWTITDIHLSVLAEVPGATSTMIKDAAELAKANCPVSRLLKANITMDINLPLTSSMEAQL